MPADPGRAHEKKKPAPEPPHKRFRGFLIHEPMDDSADLRKIFHFKYI